MYQQLTIAGYLGGDPVMRFTPGGKEVTNFSVATSRSYTTEKGVKVDETTWFRVTVWGPQATSCNQYLRKGSPVLVVGRLTPDSKTGSPTVFARKDGTMGATYELNASNVRFLPSKHDSNGTDNYNTPDDLGGDEPQEEKVIPF